MEILVIEIDIFTTFTLVMSKSYKTLCSPKKHYITL